MKLSYYTLANIYDMLTTQINKEKKAHDLLYIDDGKLQMLENDLKQIKKAISQKKIQGYKGIE